MLKQHSSPLTSGITAFSLEAGLKPALSRSIFSGLNLDADEEVVEKSLGRRVRTAGRENLATRLSNEDIL